MAWYDSLFNGQTGLTDDDKKGLVQQGLLSAGLSIAALNRRPGITPWQAIAGGLLGGLGQLQDRSHQLVDDRYKQQQQAFQSQQQQYQLQQMQRQQMLQGIAAKHVVNGQFDQQGYLNELSQVDPAAAQDYKTGVLKQQALQTQAAQKPTRELNMGSQVVTQELDPATGQWNTIAKAPRWAPQQSANSALNQRIGLLKQYGATDDDIRSALGIVGPSSAAANPNGLTGQEYIKTLPAEDQSAVQALIDGRYPVPTGKAALDPKWQRLVSLAQNADPTFDAGTYGSRAQARKAFTSGKIGQNINSLNTLAEHLGTLNEAIDGLDNSSLKVANRVKNFWNSETGDPRIAKFQAAAKAVGDEGAKAFAGQQTALSDRQKIESQLDPNASPAQLKATLQQYAELVEGKLTALQDQADQSLGYGSRNIHIVSPKARQTFDRFRSGGAPVQQNPAQAGTGWSIQRVD